MKLSEMSSHTSPWFDGSGPLAEIVISSRIRLARNIAGYKFVSRCTAAEQRQVLEKLRDAILELRLGEDLFYIGIDRAPTLDRDFLVERHLISRQHAAAKGPRGVVIARRESFTAMINEEDHLRMQVFRPGLQLKQCWQQLDQTDDLLEQRLDFAFDRRYGYLTACPTNLGTGIRVSVMLHLPALKMTGHLTKACRAAKDMNLAVRGLFGEGTDAIGDFYQISNQTTLGICEPEIIEHFTDSIIPEIIEYENLARQQLLARQPDLLDDKIFRAVGTLKNAHIISSQEALLLLSRLRMGVNMKRLAGPSIPTINELFMLTQPAHLQLNAGEPLDTTRRDALRAEIIRSRLSKL
jgi:protein arginine kinase